MGLTEMLHMELGGSNVEKLYRVSFCVHPSSPCNPLQGVGPTVQRAAVLAGVLLPSYDLCKKTFLGWGLDDRITAHFM